MKKYTVLCNSKLKPCKQSSHRCFTNLHQSRNKMIIRALEECRYTVYYTVFQKSDAKFQITITMAHLIRINYPLSSFNCRLSDTNVANLNKIHHIVSEQQLLKNGTQKQNFPIWKIPIKILTAESVTNDIILVTLLLRVCLA